MTKEIYQDDNGNSLPTIESWALIATTTDGVKLDYTLDMGYDIDDCVCQTVDDNIAAKYPCSWLLDKEN